MPVVYLKEELLSSRRRDMVGSLRLHEPVSAYVSQNLELAILL
jgi:hypothetical protein